MYHRKCVPVGHIGFTNFKRENKNSGEIFAKHRVICRKKRVQKARSCDFSYEVVNTSIIIKQDLKNHFPSELR